MVSFEEPVAVYTDVTIEQLAEMRTNGDGNLDSEERTPAIDAGRLVMPE